MSHDPQVDGSEVRKALFGSYREYLKGLREFNDSSLENQQQVRRELQNRYHGVLPILTEMLHGYFFYHLTPLMNMLPEDEDYPEIVWVRKWFIEPEINEEETKYLPQYIVKATAEALASQCQVVNVFWESVCFSLLPVFKQCFEVNNFLKFGFVSKRFNAWIIRVVGDPKMCPNSDLRLQMLLLYRWLLKVDNDNHEEAIESLIMVCSFVDSNMDTINIVDMSDIIQCMWKFTEIEMLDTFLMQFGVRITTKLSLHRKMREQILIHDLSFYQLLDTAISGFELTQFRVSDIKLPFSDLMLTTSYLVCFSLFIKFSWAY